MKTHRFKPFDRVLVRENDDDQWRCQFYSHPYGDFHACLNGVHVQCIPFAGNEALLGTTNGPEPELKKGDAVLVWDKGDFHKKIRIYSRYDGRFHRHVVLDCFFSNGSADEYMFDCAEKFVPATVEG